MTIKTTKKKCWSDNRLCYEFTDELNSVESGEDFLKTYAAPISQIPVWSEYNLKKEVQALVSVALLYELITESWLPIRPFVKMQMALTLDFVMKDLKSNNVVRDFFTRSHS